jgi:small subunit ribosomal protein S1
LTNTQTMNTGLSTLTIDGPDEKQEQHDFADLLDDFDYRRPRRGQILTGEILSVDENEVMVDVGLKRDAVVPRQDLERLEDGILEALERGAMVDVYVMQPWGYDGDLVVSINKALQQAEWQRFKDLLDGGEVIEAEVAGHNKGGLLVDCGFLTGFVPQSHVVSIPRSTSGEDLARAKSDLVGETLTLKVIEIDRQRNRLVLSERKARSAVRRARMAELEEGQVVDGRVTALVDFGAFVDIGGVEGLIHVSKLDRGYVKDPGEVLSVGDEVTVLVDRVNVEHERISLNREALLPDPWETIDEHHQEGDLVTGTVVRIADFGVFVALPAGITGLLHKSQMSNYGPQPEELVRPGDEILVRIISIDHQRKRVGLSLDAVTAEEQEAWMHERFIEGELPAEEPSAEEPSAGELPAEEPSAGELPAEELPAEEPSAGELPAEEPSAEEPSAEELSAEEPSVQPET